MPRSIKKGPFVDQYLIDKVEKNVNKEPIKTYRNGECNHLCIRIQDRCRPVRW